MVSIMIGSSVFSLLLSKGFRAEETLRIILVILALSMGICCVMASPNRNTNDMVIIYAAFLILEVAIGMYFPAMSYLKSQIIPEGHRANVRVHHMFLRILNHLGIFVIVCSREKNVFSIKITVILAFYNSDMKNHLEQMITNGKFYG